MRKRWREKGIEGNRDRAEVHKNDYKKGEGGKDKINRGHTGIKIRKFIPLALEPMHAFLKYLISRSITVCPTNTRLRGKVRAKRDKILNDAWKLAESKRCMTVVDSSPSLVLSSFSPSLNHLHVS